MQFSKTIESASNMSNRWFAERLLSDLKSNFGRLTAAQWYWVKKIVDGDYESTPVKKNAVITKRDIQKMNQPGFMSYPHEGIVIDDDQSLPVPFLAEVAETLTASRVALR